MLDNYGRTCVALWLTAPLLVVIAGCDLGTTDARNEGQSGAVKDESKGEGWKPGAIPDVEGSESKADAAASSAANHSDASAPDADTRQDDDIDAGAPSERADMNVPMPGSGACTIAGGGNKEVCNTIDDDCDKKVDEDCECPSTEPVACYDGPSGTLDVGNCRAGTRGCAPGALGPCVGAIVPSAETCNEVDDDCNGRVDDLPSLAEDPNNCGACGTVCGRGESCCSGRCVDPDGDDVQHCGACGVVCGEGALPGCCRGRCVDLLTDQTCGNCNNACGLVCSCSMTESDGPQCVAQRDNNEWFCQ